MWRANFTHVQTTFLILVTLTGDDDNNKALSGFVWNVGLFYILEHALPIFFKLRVNVLSFNERT
jgi:hypothetical protein